MLGKKNFLILMGIITFSVGVFLLITPESSLTNEAESELKNQNRSLASLRIEDDESKNQIANQHLFFKFIEKQIEVIDFRREIKGSQMGKSIPQHLLVGKIEMHPLKKTDQSWIFLSKFTLANIKSELISENSLKKMKRKNVANSDDLENSLLVEIQFNGKVNRISAMNKKPSDEVSINYADILRSVFLVIPQTARNNIVEVVEDEEGNQLSTEFFFKTGKIKNQIQIEAKGLFDKTIDNTLLGVEKVSDHNMTWSLERSLPVNHYSRGLVSIEHDQKKIAEIEVLAESKWSNGGTSKFDASVLAGFNRTIDTKKIREQSKNADLLGKKESHWSEAKSLLGQVKSDEGHSDSSNQIFGQLVELLLSNHFLSTEYIAEAQRLQSGVRQRSMLIGALGALGNSEAQKGLIEIFKQSKTNNIEKESIVTAFSISSNQITNDSKKFLKSLSENSEDVVLSKMAAYSLGHTLFLSSDDQLEAEIHDKWKNAKTNDDKIHVLGIIGNAHPESFVSEIKTAIDSSSNDLKVAAIDATRNSKDQNIKKLVMSIGNKDPDESVRAAAYHSLLNDNFNDGVFSVLKNCFKSETSSAVKNECYDILLANADVKGARQVIDEQLLSEQDLSIRARLIEFLKVY